jgi:hypothetical protein
MYHLDAERSLKGLPGNCEHFWGTRQGYRQWNSYIYVFDLKDSMEIWIGFADKIFHACHIDKSDIFEQVNNND